MECAFTAAQPGSLGHDVFRQHADDEKQGHSQEDQRFLALMDKKISIRPDGHIQLPLPLRDVSLPNNKGAVYKRTKSSLDAVRSTQINYYNVLQLCKLFIATAVFIYVKYEAVVETAVLTSVNISHFLRLQYLLTLL